jgi:hypothetical protein
MKTRNAIFVLSFVFLFAGCVAMGWRFGPGFSMYDRNYFSEPPQIRKRGSAYALEWHYGTLGWFFQASTKVVDSRLLLSLPATSSSGSLRGQHGEFLITKPMQVRALEIGGAFWLEPDGKAVRLKVTLDEAAPSS